MAEYIADYRKRAEYFRHLAANTSDRQMITGLLCLANDCELEAAKLEEAFGLDRAA
jgi:hypothetical protein